MRFVRNIRNPRNIDDAIEVVDSFGDSLLSDVNYYYRKALLILL